MLINLLHVEHLQAKGADFEPSQAVFALLYYTFACTSFMIHRICLFAVTIH